MDPVPQNKEKLCHACGSEKHEIKDCESKRNIYVIDLKRNQIIEHKLRKKLEKYGEIKSMLSNRSLATEEQAKLAIKMLNKTKYIASEYKYKKQTNNLNNSAKEKDQR